MRLQVVITNLASQESLEECTSDSNPDGKDSVHVSCYHIPAMPQRAARMWRKGGSLSLSRRLQEADYDIMDEDEIHLAEDEEVEEGMSVLIVAFP